MHARGSCSASQAHHACWQNDAAWTFTKFGSYPLCCVNASNDTDHVIASHWHADSFGQVAGHEFTDAE